MNRNAVLSLMLMAGLSLPLTACAGGQKDNGGQPTVDNTTPPEWWMKKQHEVPGVLYGYGQSAGEKNNKLAADAARADAQQKAAEAFRVHVQGLLEQYLKDVATKDAQETMRQTESAMRRVTDQSVVGFVIRDEEVVGGIWYCRGYIDYNGLSTMAEALRGSSQVQEALRKVQKDKDDFFKRLDDSIKGLGK